jgi:hypothetical protein
MMGLLVAAPHGRRGRATLLGKRSSDDTWKFTHKLYVATTGRYQISTDGFSPYQSAISLTFRYDVDFGIIVKSYGKQEKREAVGIHRRL